MSLDTKTVWIDVRVGDEVRTNGPTVITLHHKSGRAARLRVEAPSTVTILHAPGEKEVDDNIKHDILTSQR